MLGFYNCPGSTTYSGDIKTDKHGTTTIRVAVNLAPNRMDQLDFRDLPKKKTRTSEELFIESLNLRDDPPSRIIAKPRPIFNTPREMSRQGQLRLNIISRRKNEEA